jgi:hypothetical protein
MNLFQSLTKPDRKKTMLAYRVKYWPNSELSQVAKSHIVHNKATYFPKATITQLCNEDRTHLSIGSISYQIAWAWNNIPTELEWDKKSDSYLIRVERRISPLIEGGYLALLSFELPSSLDINQLADARALCKQESYQ